MYTQQNVLIRLPYDLYILIMEKNKTQVNPEHKGPKNISVLAELLTNIEAAQSLSLEEIGHTPFSARPTLDYWRQCKELKVTNYERRIWYLRKELR